jgi:hypothetical protein
VRVLLLQIKIIDFGAACDLVTGINFNPLYGMLDPRYSPPEELVMPQSEQRAVLLLEDADEYSLRHPLGLDVSSAECWCFLPSHPRSLLRIV